MKKQGIVPVFRDYVLDPTLKSAIIDVAELGFDHFVVGLAQELPGVKIVFGLGKSIISVRDRNFQIQTRKFCMHLHDGSITSHQFAKYKKELEENPKRAEKELSRVIVLLDRIIDDEKTKILASFFRAYIKDLITWDSFRELSDVLDRLFVADISLLNRIRDTENETLYQEGGYVADRLVSVGLVRNPTSNIQIGIGGFPPFGKIPLFLTDLGNQFILHGDQDND
jgi:hypothetical protein